MPGAAGARCFAVVGALLRQALAHRRGSRCGVAGRRPDSTPWPLRHDSSGTSVLRPIAGDYRGLQSWPVDNAITCHGHGDREQWPAPAGTGTVLRLPRRRATWRHGAAGAGRQVRGCRAWRIRARRAPANASSVDEARGTGASAGRQESRSCAQLPTPLSLGRAHACPRVVHAWLRPASTRAKVVGTARMDDEIASKPPVVGASCRPSAPAERDGNGSWKRPLAEPDLIDPCCEAIRRLTRC